MYNYEIFPKTPQLTAEIWQQFLQTLQNLIGDLRSWRILVSRRDFTLHFYLISPVELPLCPGQTSFILQKIDPVATPTFTTQKTALRGIYPNQWSENLIDLIQKFSIHRRTFVGLELNFCSLFKRLSCLSTLYYHTVYKNSRTQLLLPNPAGLLALDFKKSSSFVCKKVPRYLPTHKVIPFLQPRPQHAIFQVSTFPYSSARLYLLTQTYDFAKHSLVIGSSGAGKSKFLALLIDRIIQNPTENSALTSGPDTATEFTQPPSQNSPDYYTRIVVLDPHDHLHLDCRHIASRTVVNFLTPETSIDLFQNQTDIINVNVELTLDLFKTLFNDGYNGRLERVLRYSLFLLMQASQFSFNNLRKLLCDATYRHDLLQQASELLPVHVMQFFLTDFSELRTNSYNEAIAPIVAFIDEMQMVPIFQQDWQLANLSMILEAHQLTIFSFNRLILGEKITRTIAGLLAGQLFLLAQQQTFAKRLIIIIDEVAVIESPILARALSELRKYGVSIILAGQYFHQISPNLRESILANTTNYYIFRSSKTDAQLLIDNLDIKLSDSTNQPEAKVKFLTNLKTRECLVRISKDGKLQPTFLARTVDYASEDELNAPPEQVIVNPLPAVHDVAPAAPTFSFEVDDVDLNQVLQENSTSRKKLS